MFYELWGTDHFSYENYRVEVYTKREDAEKHLKSLIPFPDMTSYRIREVARISTNDFEENGR